MLYIYSEEVSRQKKKWHLFYVPMKSLLCEEYLKVSRHVSNICNIHEFHCDIYCVILQNKGVYGSLTIIDQIQACILFPFDNDLMSMELDKAFMVKIIKFFLVNLICNVIF